MNAAQEEVLLQLRKLAKQGVHPLDALAGNAVPEEEPEEPVLDSFDVAGIAKYLKDHECKDVVVMCGAGLSTAAGIPDFRTPGTGLYDTLQRFNLSQPEAIFELDFFRQEPGPFYELCRELWPGRYKPTLGHYFIKLLEAKGILRRCYTQNIDSLERQAGVSRQKIVAAHGNFDEAHIIDKVPEQAVDIEELRQAVFAGEKGWRALAEAKGGLVKPKVVLFGESLPDRFWELSDADLEACDLLIVMGTSLVVEPFAGLVGQAPSRTPRLLINREPSGTFDRLYRGFRFLLKDQANWRDVWHEGACDEGCRALTKALGWEEDLQDLMSTGKTPELAPWRSEPP